MHVDIALDLVILALAAGRVAYSLTHDEIFRTTRNWIFLHRPHRDAEVVVADPDDGDRRYPASLVHRRDDTTVPLDWFEGSRELDERWIFMPAAPARRDTFLGGVFSCVFCMSFWTSAIALTSWVIAPTVTVALAAVFAMWALANAYAVKAL